MIRVCENCDGVIELDGRTSEAKADPFFCEDCIRAAIRDVAAERMAERRQKQREYERHLEAIRDGFEEDGG